MFDINIFSGAMSLNISNRTMIFKLTTSNAMLFLKNQLFWLNSTLPSTCTIIFGEHTTNMFKSYAFSDFLNLYSSQFVNGSFKQDIDILWWETVGSLEIKFIQTNF